MNRVRYINLIKEQINNHAERISGPDYIFQQDNAPVHTSRLVHSHFNENNISILAWPARSLELNIIENQHVQQLKDRLCFAKERIRWQNKWRRVPFSDEKYSTIRKIFLVKEVPGP